jgi:CRISPR-associated exonuclease Cas4
VTPFSDVARAAYCPRQLYYARREDDRAVPPDARARIDLAFRYPALVDAPDATLRRLPIRRSPAAYRRNLDRLRERDDYDRLVDPERERAFVSGKDCHGTVHKVLGGADATDASPAAETTDAADSPDTTDASDATDPPVPVVVSPGEPPENGVWKSQSVRAVAVAKAVAWEREREVPRALVEYPSVGAVREVRITTRKRAAYRRALRAARAIDGPPSRVDDDRCSACDYREACGVGRRSFRSLLG